jgi:hypothetical protein
MTGKADFTDSQWHTVVQGPPTAGMIVLTAQRGGTFRETLSIAQAYGEARQHLGVSDLLDDIVTAKPELDRTRYHSPAELKEHGLQHLRDAVQLVAGKASAAELESYKQFVLGLAQHVAEAHREHGSVGNVSQAEQAAIDEIEGAVGAPTV